MSGRSRRALLWFVVLSLVLVCTVCCIMSANSPQTLSSTRAEPSQVHIKAGRPVVLNNPDSHKTYIAESGSNLTIIRPLGDPNLTEPLRLIARGGSQVWATGTSIHVEAQPGSKAVVSDGVSIEAEGRSSNVTSVHVVGKSQVKANAFTIIYNDGDGEEFAYAQSITYARTRGRIFAYDGSHVYAKSPEKCDACTQVQANPGSTTYVYDGAEAFAKGSADSPATVYVYKGGEVGCFHDCKLFLAPQAEFHYGPNCRVHMLVKAHEENTPLQLRSDYKHQD